MILSLIAFGLSIRFNIVYMRDLIKGYEGHDELYNKLLGFDSQPLGRTTLIRFGALFVIGIAFLFLNLFMAQTESVMNVMYLFEVESEIQFLFRWVSCMMIVNIAVTTLGKYISYKEWIKKNPWVGHVLFTLIFMSFSGIFILESDVSRVVLAVAMTYGFIVMMTLLELKNKPKIDPKPQFLILA